MPMRLRQCPLPYSVDSGFRGYLWCYCASWNKVIELVESAFRQAGLKDIPAGYRVSSRHRMALPFTPRNPSGVHGTYQRARIEREQFLAANPDRLFYGYYEAEKPLLPFDDAAIKKLTAIRL